MYTYVVLGKTVVKFQRIKKWVPQAGPHDLKNEASIGLSVALLAPMLKPLLLKTKRAKTSDGLCPIFFRSVVDSPRF